ncbi:MAG: hypothetical protein JWL89_406 [Candidatus Saccharibacteria bacterium]|nr:hypothetical protein [Candidatus Saccharibacteria bacterium]
MIVLAIAGIILLIVFLAVPSLQRASRNNTRKQAVYYALDQMHTYYIDHQSYPLTTPITCAASPSCTAFQDGLSLSGPTQLYEINYVDNGVPHTYLLNVGNTQAPIDSYDKIVIFPTHRCNRTPGVKVGDADYPVHATDATDDNFKHFAVYTLLEPNMVYCVDDISN